MRSLAFASVELGPLWRGDARFQPALHTQPLFTSPDCVVGEMSFTDFEEGILFDNDDPDFDNNNHLHIKMSAMTLDSGEFFLPTEDIPVSNCYKNLAIRDTSGEICVLT
ncbi:hypothetical protein GE061_017173 [Apolygus lucorum]|uniref:Uncharacterized protein n=1 Tax=Apolygus lucorum TaxID=248454 RepID=A0A8S9XM91_APOLU|nr:hypothetical protein GE061_017173 [Apolygus lucorum]